MIVVDASALLEALLRTPAARAVERWLFRPRQTLHAPHLIDVEVAQVIRRYAANGEIDSRRGHTALVDLADLPLRRYPHDCETISRPMTPSISPLPRRSMLRCSRAIGVSQLRPVITHESSWCNSLTESGLMSRAA
jgi:hypothetical protein